MKLIPLLRTLMRFAFSMLCGSLAAIAAWTQLSGPLWRHEAVMNTLGCFSADGRLFMTALCTSKPPKLCVWDVKTGRQISNRTIPNAASLLEPHILPSPDGKRALVLAVVRRINDFWSQPLGWYVFDLTDYQRLTPEADERLNDVRGPQFSTPFSATGKWIQGWHTVDGDPWRTKFGLRLWGDPSQNLRSTDSGLGRVLVIWSADSAKHVYVSSPIRTIDPKQLIFAPDEASAVVLYERGKADTNGQKFAIEMVDLPAGRKRWLRNLPKRPWTKIEYWDGKRLEMTAEYPTSPARSVFCQCTFLVNGDSLGPPTEESTRTEEYGQDWIHGGGWRAYFEVPPPDSWDQFLAWFNSWGLRLPQPPGIVKVAVRIEDQTTGKVRTLERRVQQPCIFSADGTRMACPTDNDGIEMWDTDPPPRWPWVAGAGFAGFFLPMGLRRAFRIIYEAVAKVRTVLSVESGYRPARIG